MIVSSIRGRTSHGNHREHTVQLYDTSSPRFPESERPELRYACIGMLGPFKSRESAEKVAATYPSLDA